ncbi:hypothetical protein F2Q68_00027615 [Brassica cretica]|uniref:Uncharacterized protein n=1 Tax=Brassica cretica TaxID=69181 RepID=A0A8S9IBX5_BRACR|nr:hypothetical protein F2Q68_00027615 [Brassica cretica]
MAVKMSFTNDPKRVRVKAVINVSFVSSAFSLSRFLSLRNPLAFSLSIPLVDGSSLLRVVSLSGSRRRSLSSRRCISLDSSPRGHPFAFSLLILLVGGSALLHDVSLGGSHWRPLCRRRSISWWLSSTDLSLCGSPKIKRFHLFVMLILSLGGSPRRRRSTLSVVLLKSKGKVSGFFFFKVDGSRDLRKGHRREEYAAIHVRVSLFHLVCNEMV